MPQFPKDWPPSEVELASDIFLRAAKSKPCRRLGLSLLRIRIDAILQAELFPELGMLIFQVKLSAKYGITQTTPASLPNHG